MSKSCAVLPLSGPLRPTTLTSRTPKLLAFLLLIFLSLNAHAQPNSADPGSEALPSDVDFRWGLQLPMRDGVKLGATHYRPAGSALEPLPTIVTITPYISDRYHPDALYFARHGFNFLVVDTRGRGNSEGEFKPLGLEDGLDGHDVVQWIAQQPWSDGKVMMRGGSYGGYNQWATARYFPSKLTTIVPIASPYHGVDFPMNDNVPYPYSIRWLTLTAGVTPQGRIFGDNAFWNRKFRAYHEAGIAFAELDDFVGHPNPNFDEWVAHPHSDDYWAARVPDADAFSRFDLPILTITGYYDGDQPGAMEYYREHMKHGSPSGKAQHFLLLGPWDHSGTRIPRQTFGGLTFGDSMMFNAFGLDRDWYNWTLGKGDRPAFIKDRVTWFVAGADRWKSAASLDAVSNDEQVLYLTSVGATADTLFESGQLASEPAKAVDSDQYRYDPLDTRKAQLDPPDAYITDQTEVVQTQGNGLIYHSEPFSAPTEISGYVELELWLELDVPDTDINATLYEITRDGQSIALAGQTLRTRYRHSRSEPVLMTPGRVEKLSFNRFYWFSRQVAEGSRLRLFLRPANGVAQMRHYNGAGPVASQTAEDAQTARIRVHIGPDTPSRLTLPLVR
ncbi:MAG: CocE/NonD family hydrolase [Pseudomonadota bacterium]